MSVFFFLDSYEKKTYIIIMESRLKGLVYINYAILILIFGYVIIYGDYY